MSCHSAHMQLLRPEQPEASFDKHIPKYEIYGNNILVQVGDEPHPMEPSHRIEWISIVTDCGVHIRFLNENGFPNASFTINSQETLKSVYEYCNIHGVWKSEYKAGIHQS